MSLETAGGSGARVVTGGGAFTYGAGSAEATDAARSMGVTLDIVLLRRLTRALAGRAVVEPVVMTSSFSDPYRWTP